MNQELIIQISEDEIKDRVYALREILEKQKKQLLKQLQVDIEAYMNKKNQIRQNRQDELYQCFKTYYKASENMFNSYFPLIMDQNYLSLQSQQQIMTKINQLKTSIKKNLKTLFDKSKMSRSEWEKQERKKNQLQRIPKKGRNSKTPIESTQVLIKWLLKNFKNPYPSNAQKDQLAHQSKLTVSQVSNWFINARERVIKKYLKKQAKETEKKKNSDVSESNGDEMME